jgi:hypothetical protein
MNADTDGVMPWQYAKRSTVSEPAPAAGALRATSRLFATISRNASNAKGSCRLILQNAVQHSVIPNNPTTIATMSNLG